ncbi:hypothetical protein TNCV_1798281 [Trichonephila clavipes]|uniref:Uncharacterized protein n=1 Tax=Trichonephila clavipes TaxID=2585209 RepID=A0A8X6SHR0_TRICX|nr:hypothetical protein TNCV_1798281 [Trichonephila clavipes]
MNLATIFLVGHIPNKIIKQAYRVGPRQWDQLKYEDSVSRRHVTDRLRVKTLSRDYLPALLVQRRTDVPLVTIHVVTSRTRISVTAVKRYRYTMHVSVQDVQSC